MLTIRPMLETDADVVRQVDRLAFMPLLKKYNPNGPYSIRRRENVLSARAIFPQGCFVAEDSDGLAGYVFSRVWGQVGWVGVFGVHPQRQGGQVGKQLLTEAVRGLEEAGCSTIGLETMPDSAYNIGLYARRGFRPIMMTLTMEKAIDTPPDLPEADMPEADLPPLPGACRVLGLNDEGGLEAVSALSRAAWPELDLRAEAVNALTYGWGEVVLLGEAARPPAAAVVRVEHRRESESGTPLPNPVCEISALASLPEARARLGESMCLLEGYAARQGFEQMRVAFNSADWQSVQVLLGAGYRVVHSALRFILRGDYTAQAGLEFSRWAM